VRHHFRIGLRGEKNPLAFELFLELTKILDDAVVNDGHLAGDMRMRVHLVGSTVRRPAGMADTGGSVQRSAIELAFEFAELAGRSQPFDAARLDGGDPG
jgi:hypothetical protein